MYLRLTSRKDSWRIRSRCLTGSKEIGKDRVNPTPIYNVWLSSGNDTNSSLKTDHLVDQIHNRSRAFKIQVRAFFSIQLSASCIVSKPLMY